MSDFDSMYGQGLYLSPQQQDLLMAALASNHHSGVGSTQQNGLGTPPKSNSMDQSPSLSHSQNFDVASSNYLESPVQDMPGSGTLGAGSDESPFLEFDPDGDYDFSGQLIGDLPDYADLGDENDTREKRKSIDGDSDELESGKKRRESDGDKDKSAKKPGRKPLTSEPTSKRKAQNRAAQRAFRERKEKHLKDLETKVDELEKASETTNQENGVLRAQVERLQVELREYRKRLSWLSTGNGFSTASAIQDMSARNNLSNLKNIGNSDFYFDFPKFGDLPGSHIFNNKSTSKSSQNKNTNDSSRRSSSSVPGVLGRSSINSNGNRTNNFTGQTGSVQNKSTSGRNSLSESAPSNRATPASQMSFGFPSTRTSLSNPQGINSSYQNLASGGSSAGSTTDSPSSSSESQHGQTSSIGTSPEPSLNSPSMSKTNGASPEGDKIAGETSFCEKLSRACGSIKDPVPAIMKEQQSNDFALLSDQFNSTVADSLLSFDWLAQQNGGNFDPVLFNDYREPQDAILSQDFGTFFNEAFPLPDLGSPLHNFNDVTTSNATQSTTATAPAPKTDLVAQIDSQLNADNDVVPGEDKSQMMNCTKIWDRLQSMEKFRNGEIDVDSLCSELRTKAKCSESGVVVQKRDVDDIMGRVQH